VKTLTSRLRDRRLAQLLEPVEAGMEQMRACVSSQLASDHAAVSEMTEHLGSFRGKQLRAALVLLSAHAAGNEHPELPQVASVIEMIHLATLVHDDVLDGAEVRRRVACVNERWDNQVAVLLGDLLYARAFHLSTTLSSPMVSEVLSRATQRICEGEIIQAGSRRAFEMDVEQYETIAAAKTATLYRAACELGAAYPTADNPRQVAALASFGEDVGLAFQIVDDVLDLVGEQEAVGKSVGNDVQDGKVTLPVLATYASADEPVRAAIRAAYGDADVGDRRAALRSACDLQAGVDRAMERARDLVAQANNRLECLDEGPSKEALSMLGDYVLERKW
jgi:octaprenyl-diphosphate synthase